MKHLLLPAIIAATLLMSVQSNAQSAVSDDEITAAHVSCLPHWHLIPAGSGVSYDPGWEHCRDIDRAYQAAAPGIAEKAKLAKDEQDRQKSIDAAKKLKK